MDLFYLISKGRCIEIKKIQILIFIFIIILINIDFYNIDSNINNYSLENIEYDFKLDDIGAVIDNLNNNVEKYKRKVQNGSNSLNNKLAYIKLYNPNISNNDAIKIITTIQSELKKYPILNFDVVFAQIAQESSFNPRCVGRDNDSGLMQILPSTGIEIARKLGVQNYNKTMLFDIQTNIQFGMFYLNEKYHEASKYSSNHETKMRLALVAYNAGASRSFSHYRQKGNYFNNYHEKVFNRIK